MKSLSPEAKKLLSLLIDLASLNLDDCNCSNGKMPCDNCKYKDQLIAHTEGSKESAFNELRELAKE